MEQLQRMVTDSRNARGVYSEDTMWRIVSAHLHAMESDITITETSRIFGGRREYVVTLKIGRLQLRRWANTNYVLIWVFVHEWLDVNFPLRPQQVQEAQDATAEATGGHAPTDTTDNG